MKIILKMLISLTAVLLLTQCTKDNTLFHFYFWTGQDTTDARLLHLYVNEEYKGELPYFNVEDSLFDCNNDSIKQKALEFLLPTGRYVITAKDRQGKTELITRIRVSSNLQSVASSSDASSPGGGIRSTGNFEDCFMSELSLMSEKP